MQEEYKKKSPYHGFLLLCLLLIIVPLALYGVLRWAINVSMPVNRALNNATAQAIGFGLGSVFHLSCIVAGAFEDAIRAVKDRIGEFFANLTVSPLFALQCYWDDMKNDGVVMLISALIMIACAAVSADGVRTCLRLLSQ